MRRARARALALALAALSSFTHVAMSHAVAPRHGGATRALTAPWDWVPDDPPPGVGAVATDVVKDPLDPSCYDCALLGRRGRAAPRGPTVDAVAPQGARRSAPAPAPLRVVRQGADDGAGDDAMGAPQPAPQLPALG